MPRAIVDIDEARSLTAAAAFALLRETDGDREALCLFGRQVTPPAMTVEAQLLGRAFGIIVSLVEDVGFGWVIDDEVNGALALVLAEQPRDPEPDS